MSGNDNTTGYIHSFITGSTVDGPGVRFVLWTTGCLMRCTYCHNPDTWHMKNGQEHSLTQIMDEIGKYERFLRIAKGGVTVSGGEPLVQAGFVMNILRSCKERGIHTALDTNGYLGDRLSDEDLQQIDLVLLDIKSWQPATHRRVTGVDVEPILRFARRLSDLGRPAWIRFVMVPGQTDDPENMHGLAEFVSTLTNVQRVELLPFHQMGRSKWQKLGLNYPLNDTLSPTANQLECALDTFRAHGLQPVC